MKLEFYLNSKNDSQFEDFINEVISEKVQYSKNNVQDTKYTLHTIHIKGESHPNALCLSKIKDAVQNSKFHYGFEYDGVSVYLCKRLYEHFNLFEQKLRKLIKLIDFKQGVDFKAPKDLYEKYYRDYFQLIFVDCSFIKNVRKYIDDNGLFSKTDISDFILKEEEKPVISLFYSEYENLCIYKNYVYLHDMRNKVMHSKIVTLEEFETCLSYLKQSESELDKIIDNLIEGKNKQYAPLVEGMAAVFRFVAEKYDFSNTFKTIGETIDKISINYDYGKLYEAFKKLDVFNDQHDDSDENDKKDNSGDIDSADFGDNSISKNNEVEDGDNGNKDENDDK